MKRWDFDDLLKPVALRVEGLAEAPLAVSYSGYALDRTTQSARDFLTPSVSELSPTGSSRSQSPFSPVVLPLVDDAGHTNVFPVKGTLRFWFKPETNAEREARSAQLDAVDDLQIAAIVSEPGTSGIQANQPSSTRTPGFYPRLLELVSMDPGGNASVVWSLYLNPQRTEIRLSKAGLQRSEDCLWASVHLTNDCWQLIALAWDSNGTRLYVDGQLTAEGSPLPAFNPADSALIVGSDWHGRQLAGGLFDDLTSLPVALKPAVLAQYFNGMVKVTQSDALVTTAQASRSASLSQAASTLAASASSFGPPGFDSGGGTNAPDASQMSFAPDYGSELWLEITNVTNGLACLNLHNATNLVYAILGKTNLLDANWSVEKEIRPDTNGTTIPFTLPTLNRDMLFLRARDWTGVDDNSNGVADWWEWRYFGTTSIAVTNLDCSDNGLTFAEDYSNSIAPTVFNYSGIDTADNCFNYSPVPARLAVNGFPYSIAMLVDDSSFDHAVWSPYGSSSLTVNLQTEGWHELWIGLRGHADEASAAVWQWKRLKLDTTPPHLVITIPTNRVTMPLIQLTGCSAEALSRISCDISNAAGTATNQLAVITGQFFNTTTREFTTNDFHCYDVPLTNGLNVITIHAVDLAGNSASLTTNITCLGRTNPPAVELLWPQDGMRVCGESITIKGRVDDPTALVSVAIVDAEGNTNTFGGRTGRDGIFWVENVLLIAATNNLSLAASTPAGDGVTNFTLFQSSIGLTINTVLAGQTLVTGNIGSADYTIWVNGVEATQDNGGWSATITPICIGGGQVAVAAIPNSDNGGHGSGGLDPAGNPQSPQSHNTQTTVQPPEGVYLSEYHLTNQVTWLCWPTANYSTNLTYASSMIWQDGKGGDATASWFWDWLPTAPGASTTDWPATFWPQELPNGTEIVTDLWKVPTESRTNEVVSPGIQGEHCDIRWVRNNENGQRQADAEMKLATGGPLGSKQMNLWVLSATATDAETGEPINPTNITIGSFGNLDTNAELWVQLPDNDPANATPKTSWKRNYRFEISGTKYPLAIMANTNILSETGAGSDAVFCVGQAIYFNVVGLHPKIKQCIVKWILPGTYVNRQPDENCLAYYDKDSTLLNVTNSTTTCAWYVKDIKEATVSVKVFYTYGLNTAWFTQTNSGKFRVQRPTTTFIPPGPPHGTPTVLITNGCLALGWNGSMDMNFGHKINPDKFPGLAGYTQVVGDDGDVIHTYLNNIFELFPLNQLDNLEFPRGQIPAQANTNTPVRFCDGPHVSLANNDTETYEKLHFHTYFLFKPLEGPGPNIFVPLREVKWMLDCSAVPHWSVDRNTVDGPFDNSCSSFPHWTGIIYNTW